MVENGSTKRTWTVADIKRRKKKLNRIFILLALISIIINLDGGAVPAGLIHIEKTFGLSVVESGLVGMLVYQGIALGCLTVGPTLRVISGASAATASAAGRA